MARMTRALSLALLGGALLLGPARAASDPKSFRDWMAGCDNTATCTALSLPADGAMPVAMLRLERPAGPDGVVKLALRLRGDGKAPPKTLRLTLDGSPFPVAGTAAKSADGDEDSVVLLLSPAETTRLIEAMRKATTLSVSADGTTASVSLAGSVAALLWIDEQQGRLGTTSALIRKGSKTAVPPAPPLPVIAARPAPPMLDPQVGKRLATALRKRVGPLDPDTCENDDDLLVESDESWALDGSRRLVALGCSRGAYNIFSAFWIVSGEDVAGAVPLHLPGGDGKDHNVLGNASFDPRTGRLGYFSKGRGLADCGALGGYAWTGAAFVETDLSRMDECRGIAPEDWITLYRSELR